jgi:peroxiredoxin
MTIVLWVLLGVLLLAVVSLAWLLVQVIRQQGRLLLRIEALERPTTTLETSGTDPARGGLPLATAFPPFRLPDLEGKEVELDDFETRVLLVHWSPECGFCREIAADLARYQGDLLRRNTELVLVSYGSPESNRALVKAHGLQCPVLLQADRETIEGFARMGTPVAYLLDDRGRIAKPVAVGAREVPELVAEAAGNPGRLARERPLSESLIEREGLKAGVPAPTFELPDLWGHTISLADQRGRKVLLIFSDPECGPCEALLPDLARLAVVMVSRGEPAENQRKAEAFGIEFQVVLQPGWRLSKKYGIFATPVAFLINEEGVIERDVARGPTEILAVAREALSAEGRVPVP